MEALVKETLTKEQVKELLDNANYLSMKWQWNDHLYIYKGYFITWDNERHEGCIVQHHKEKEIDLYFMEVELEEVSVSEYGHIYKPTYHMLMPISERKRVSKFYDGDTKALVQHIIKNSMSKETWGYYKVPMTGEEICIAKKTHSYSYLMNDYTKLDELKYSEIDYWNIPLSDLEKKTFSEKKRAEETELIKYFTKGNLPEAEDDIWYKVLSMGFGTSGYDLECKIIKILRSQGYLVQINGERDSFGWVTRGIFVNGKMMCLI